MEHLFGMGNVREGVVDITHKNHCIRFYGLCGGKCPDVVQTYVDEVSAHFLCWYLFTYIKAEHVMACCGPDVMRHLLYIVEEFRNVKAGVVEMIHNNHSIGFYGVNTREDSSTNHPLYWAHHNRNWSKRKVFDAGKKAFNNVQR